MNLSLIFVRIFFFILSIFLITTYMLGTPTGTTSPGIGWGVFLGALLGCVLIGFDFLFRRFNLRSFNIATLGLFIGYLMGQALLLVFNAVVDIGSITFQPHTLEVIKISLFLFGT
ncbi:MAG: hypothetical protein JSS09_05280, partial [Verrucomicrobia bacterium]|nr:hypothetical protein [Verrucomicrobiota bacterium]